MNRPLVLAAATAIVVVAAACSGDDSADPTTTFPSLTSTLTTTASPTTVAPTTTAATTEPPSTTVSAPTTNAPVTTGQLPPSGPPASLPFPLTAEGQPDWVPIVQELIVTGTELNLEPNVDRITEYCLENTACYEDWRAYIENMIAEDAHAEGVVPDRVLSVEIGQAQGDRDPIETGAVVLTAQLEVVGNEEGARIADSAGNTLFKITRDAQPGDIVEMSFFLGLDFEYEWRVIQESTSES